MSDKTRTEFEAWAAEHGTRNFGRDEATGMYCILIVEGKWKAWLASRKSALEEAAQVCEATYIDERGPLRIKRPVHETAHDCAAAIRAAAESRQGGETS